MVAVALYPVHHLRPRLSRFLSRARKLSRTFELEVGVAISGRGLGGARRLRAAPRRGKGQESGRTGEGSGGNDHSEKFVRPQLLVVSWVGRPRREGLSQPDRP